MTKRIAIQTREGKPTDPDKWVAEDQEGRTFWADTEAAARQMAEDYNHSVYRPRINRKAPA